MTEPAGNTGPNGTFVATCTVLTCAMNSTGTVDPEGHTIKGYSWNWGDGTANSTGASPSHTYALPGTYTITMTATDSWNRAGAPVTREVTMTEPAGNQGPTAVIPAPTCTATNTTCAFTSTGSIDPEGHTPLRYLWDWGDGTANSTSSSSSHVFPVAGTLHGDAHGHRRVGPGRCARHPRGDDVAGAGWQHRADRHLPAAGLHGPVVCGQQRRDHRPARHPGLLVELG